MDDVEIKELLKAAKALEARGLVTEEKEALREAVQALTPAPEAAETSSLSPYRLVAPPSNEVLKSAANDKISLKIWPYAATPELCVHTPSNSASDVCCGCGYAITLNSKSTLDDLLSGDD